MFCTWKLVSYDNDATYHFVTDDGDVLIDVSMESLKMFSYCPYCGKHLIIIAETTGEKDE